MTSSAKLLPPSPAGQERSAPAGQRVYTVVLADLSERIRRGDWLPGTRLPSINRLARELKVGAGTVREALRSLQSMGLVTIEHGRGVFVANRGNATGLESFFEQGETGAILALAEIEDLAREMELEAQHGQDFVRPDVAFHQCIAGAARNVVLYRVMVGLHDLLIESRRITSREAGMTARAVHYHLLIAGALRARDAGQARLLMLAHMNDMLSGLLLAQARLQSGEE